MAGIAIGQRVLKVVGRTDTARANACRACPTCRACSTPPRVWRKASIPHVHTRMRAGGRASTGAASTHLIHVSARAASRGPSRTARSIRLLDAVNSLFARRPDRCDLAGGHLAGVVDARAAREACAAGLRGPSRGTPQALIAITVLIGRTASRGTDCPCSGKRREQERNPWRAGPGASAPPQFLQRRALTAVRTHCQ